MANLMSRDEFKKVFESELNKQLIPSVIESSIIKGLLETEFFTIEEKEYINNFITDLNEGFSILLTEDTSLNEGFLENFKNKVANAADEIGKGVADKLSKVADTVKNVAKEMVDYLKKLWDEGVKFYHSQFAGNKDKIIEKFKDKSDKFFTALNDELKDFKSTISFWVNGFISKLTTGIQSMFPKAVEEGIDFSDLKSVNEFLSVFESGGHGESHGGISKVIHALADKPPFSWLHALQTKYKIVIGSSLNKFSEVTAEFGGPGPYEFEALALVAAAFAELKSKDVIKAFVVKPLFKILLGPIGATIVSVVGYVALAITVYETAEALAKMHSSGGEHKEEPASSEEH